MTYVPLYLSCDGSPVGVGAVIFHTLFDNTEKVIAYASRKLSQAKKNYAQIQKEALVIIFRVQKFCHTPPWMQILFDN